MAKWKKSWYEKQADEYGDWWAEGCVLAEKANVFVWRDVFIALFGWIAIGRIVGLIVVKLFFKKEG